MSYKIEVPSGSGNFYKVPTIKKSCKTCGYWDKTYGAQKCKCYTKNCPARQRDEKNKKK